MIISEKIKAYLIGGFVLVSVVTLINYLGEIVLPFVFALFLAYLLNPAIVKLQKIIKNRKLAVTSFLLSPFF